MRPAPPCYDRRVLVERIKDGYHRAEMSARPDDTSTLALKELQQDRARDEERHARHARGGAEERTHRRRADKAAYLRDKLAEAERSERDDG
jgi:hypothetical protein